MKKIIITILVILVAGAIVYFATRDRGPEEPVALEDPQFEIGETDDVDSTEPYEVIGTSVNGNEIRSFRFGEGENLLVFVGAIHGGYEWNTALLSYQMIDYLNATTTSIPSDISVVVIPVANPDGLIDVVGTSERFEASDAPQFDFASDVAVDDPVVASRFNANNVDLNRNFDCKWQPEAIWGTHTVSAGSSVFSEPESVALRDFLLAEKPVAAVFFHSASDGAYTSFCEGDALSGTTELLRTYSEASGYPKYESYPYYEVTGDVTDWLSTVGIPAIGVELSTHKAIEWEKNLAGVEAMFRLYSGAE